MLPDPIETVKLGLAAEILRSGRPICLRALGSSMLPSIWPGDLVHIANCAPADIAVGDIACFLQADRFVIHRVVALDRNDGQVSCLTRGDSLTRNDVPLCGNQLLGRVAAIHRNGRWVAPARRLSGAGYLLACILREAGLVRSVLLRTYACLRHYRAAEYEFANHSTG